MAQNPSSSPYTHQLSISELDLDTQDLMGYPRAQTQQKEVQSGDVM